MDRIFVSFLTATGLMVVTSVALAQGADEPRTDRRAEMLAMLDADGDGNITSAEIQAHRSAAFPSIDANSDGVLTAEEMTGHHEAKRAQQKANRQNRHFTRLDSDGDGVVNETEFMSARMPMFDRLDSNSDGVISAEEIENAPPRPRSLGQRGGGQ